MPKGFKLAASIILGLLLLLLIAIYIFLYFQQTRLIFYPEKINPDKKWNFNGLFEERWITVSGKRVHSLYFRASHPHGVVLYFHGNAGSLRTWGFVGEELSQRSSWDVWVVDYPGYGKSEGEIQSEAQLHEIARAMYELVAPSGQPIVVMGRSIGSGLAVKLASEKPVAGLILETPYLSLQDLAKELLPWVPPFSLRFTLRSSDWISKVQAPILIVHGTKDEVIPFSQGERLAKVRPKELTFVAIPGGHHNDLGTFQSYWTSLTEFLKNVAGQK